MSGTNENGFVTLGKRVSIFRPQNAGTVEPSHPTLVLIFGWMGAKPPHLHKYTSVYREKYPKSTIILTRAEPSFFWTLETQRLKALAPLVEALESLGCITPPSKDHSGAPSLPAPLIPHRILIHAFSNGGCFQLITLGKLLLSRRVSPSLTSPHTTSALILDSCPGNASFTASQRAFSSAISNPLVRLIIRFSVALFFCVQLILKHIFRKQPIINIMRAKLNNPIQAPLPWLNKATPRLYLYSEGDEMVAVESVEEHIADAKAKGFKTVSGEKFGVESMHVSHARTDPRRYWAAVEKMWKLALELETERK